jgi:hypothetical protein
VSGSPGCSKFADEREQFLKVLQAADAPGRVGGFGAYERFKLTHYPDSYGLVIGLAQVYRLIAIYVCVNGFPWKLCVLGLQQREM